MTIQMKKVWFVDGQIIEQEIPESDIYKRDWDIDSCKAYAEQLRDKNRANTAEHAAEAIEYLLALAQPEQKPAMWVDPDWIKYGGSGEDKICDSQIDGWIPLYTSPPPQRTWVGLTDEERDEICLGDESIAQSIEAKLREKNGGNHGS